MTPAIPEAASTCPMFGFRVPNGSGSPAARAAPSTAPSARVSAESPSWVPVPWAST